MGKDEHYGMDEHGYDEYDDEEGSIGKDLNNYF